MGNKYILYNNYNLGPENETLSAYELTTVDGLKFLVGHDADRVLYYFSHAMQQHLHTCSNNNDKVKNLQSQVIKAMTYYYQSLGLQDCLLEIKKLANTLISNNTIANDIDCLTDSLTNTTPKPKLYNTREKPQYDSEIENCFVVSSEFEDQNVYECLSATCEAVKEQFDPNTVSVTDVPDIMCGKQRDMLVKGDAKTNKIWIAQLIREYCINQTICKPVYGQGKVWQSAGQAFLRSDHTPYALDNFSNVKIDSPESLQFSNIIRKQQNDYGLIKPSHS